jgi:N-acetylglutamate synthase-like GNAT family acetyltransferase
MNAKSSQVIITQFRPEYRTGVIELIVPIQQKEFDIPITAQDQPDLQNIPDFYQKDKGNFWVAIHEQKIVGSIALLDIGNNQAALRKMFVQKAYRGSEYGIAKQLLTSLFEWARDKQVKQIYLGTTAKFLAAHRFYEKNGFEEVGEKNLPERFPIMSVDTKFYKYEF